MMETDPSLVRFEIRISESVLCVIFPFSLRFVLLLQKCFIYPSVSYLSIKKFVCLVIGRPEDKVSHVEVQMELNESRTSSTVRNKSAF